MSLDAVLLEVKAVLRTVDGLRSVPDEPPEQINAFPVCLVYPGSGRMQLGPARGPNGLPRCWEFHTVTIDIYQNRSDIARDLLTVRPFSRSVPAALIAAYATDRFNGTVALLGDPQLTSGTWPVRYALIMPEPGGINAVGYRFELDVSFQEDIT